MSWSNRSFRPLNTGALVGPDTDDPYRVHGRLLWSVSHRETRLRLMLQRNMTKYRQASESVKRFLLRRSIASAIWS